MFFQYPACYLFSSCVGSFSFSLRPLLHLLIVSIGCGIWFFSCLVLFDFSLPLFLCMQRVTLFLFSNTWFLFVGWPGCLLYLLRKFALSFWLTFFLSLGSSGCLQSVPWLFSQFVCNPLVLSISDGCSHCVNSHFRVFFVCRFICLSLSPVLSDFPFYLRGFLFFLLFILKFYSFMYCFCWLLSSSGCSLNMQRYLVLVFICLVIVCLLFLFVGSPGCSLYLLHNFVLHFIFSVFFDWRSFCRWDHLVLCNVCWLCFWSDIQSVCSLHVWRLLCVKPLSFSLGLLVYLLVASIGL